MPNIRKCDITDKAIAVLIEEAHLNAHFPALRILQPVAALLAPKGRTAEGISDCVLNRCLSFPVPARNIRQCISEVKIDKVMIVYATRQNGVVNAYGNRKRALSRFSDLTLLTIQKTQNIQFHFVAKVKVLVSARGFIATSVFHTNTFMLPIFWCCAGILKSNALSLSILNLASAQSRLINAPFSS